MDNNNVTQNYRYIAVLCYIGAFMGPFGGNVVNVLIPRLQTEFNTTFYSISLAISIYMIAFAFFQLISGFISDILGRRNVIIFGYSFFGLGCIICYFSRSLGVFLAGRFIQGMSNAFMTPVLMALLGDVVPRAELGKFIGFFSSIQTAGTFLAPVIGGMFAEINWRYVFLLLTVLAFILTVIYYITFTYTSRELKRRLLPSLLYSTLVTNRKVLLLSLSSFTGYFGFGSLSFLFAKYIYMYMGVSEKVNGLIVSLTGLSSIIFSPFAGRLSDRYNRVTTSIVGIIPIIPLVYIIPFIKNAYLLSLVLFIMGGFSAMVWSSINTLAVDTMPEIRGTVSSLINSFKYFSFSVSPVFYGKIYEIYGMGNAFKAASIAVFLQLAIMLLYGRGSIKKNMGH